MDMNAESHGLQERYTRIIIVLLGIICVFLFLRGLYNGGDIFIPFILASFLLYILNPIIEFFEKLKVPSKLAVMLSLVVTWSSVAEVPLP